MIPAMAMLTALTPSFFALRRELKVARQTFRSIARLRISEDAPIEDQHRYWRLHDTARAVYGRLDWRWQSLTLRAGLLASAASVGAAVAIPDASPCMGIALTYTAWRLYVVVERLVPFADDK